jgi:hypothetical protein
MQRFPERFRTARLMPWLSISLAFRPDIAAAQQDPPQTGTGLGSIVTSSNTKVEVGELSDGVVTPFNTEEDQLRPFNLASCLCDETFHYQVESTVPEVQIPQDVVGRVWFGNNCATSGDAPDERCANAVDFDLQDIATGRAVFEGSVKQLISPKKSECDRVNSERSIFLLANQNNTDEDHEVNISATVKIDTRPPAVPSNIETVGVEQGIRVSWDLSSGNVGDIAQYQFLCKRADGVEQDTSEFDETRRFDVCASASQDPFAAPGALRAAAGDGVQGQAVATDEPLPEELRRLDDAFLCGTTSSTTGARISGLENGVPYRVVLVAVDRAGNPSAVDIGVATPIPATDFWELYKERNGRAQGGLCNAGGGAGDWLAIALALAALWGMGRRRRGDRGRRAGAAAGLVLLVASGASARANPYWDEVEPEESAADELRSRWNVGIALSPYRPDVDSEFAAGEGPFLQTFGPGRRVMGRVELDRYFLWPAGQLGLTGSLGYASRSANAFTGDVADDLRSPGDTTTFRLFPTSLGAVYRFTALADHTRVPLVPYGKLGLAYYVWWITGPPGGTAETEQGDDGFGASLGWQASLGVALRAESIDGGAARALRNEYGIEHAGIYGELTHADVDGFGAGDKLSVGDTTWAAGINFEF